MELTAPINKINRVAKAMAAKLKALGMTTVEDLLFYLPFRYDNFSESLPIGQLVAGSRANVVGEIELISNKRSFKRRLAITEALISDDSGVVKTVWFNQPFLVKNLKVGDTVSLSGKVEEECGQPVMISPVYEKIYLRPNYSLDQGDEKNLDPFLTLPLPRGGKNDEDLTPALSFARRGGSSHAPAPSYARREGNIHTQGLVPNYNLTANLTQKQLRFLISQVIGLAGKLVDYLPADIKKNYQLVDLPEAIRQIHFPITLQQAEAAKKRLAFDELLFLQLRVQTAKNSLKRLSAVPIIFKETATKEFVGDLPFKLTADQKRSAWEIIKDIGLEKPMTRLLEGDVGTGKTIVALLAILNTAHNKLQSALLAPTEVLAGQHFSSISRLLVKTGFNLGLLTGAQCRLSGVEKIKRGELIKKIASGEVDLVIGTHALIQETISFKNLALVVVDEQHRFGVEQRQTMLKKTSTGNQVAPHLLSMTATPIPRSLALALYDDLSLSIIKEQPIGRLPIITKIFVEDERLKAYEFIRREIERGRQAFVICPLIDPSDKLGAKSATSEYNYLQATIFPEYKLSLLHGKLKTADKEKVMADFMSGATNILVATAVVEVGIDVPNATVMMIESADRFGLAQLHQYRGRVGRSEHQSYCLLASVESAGKAQERLAVMLKFNNGFDLAKADLKFRGPGEVYGTLQKGFTDLKVANLFDLVLISQAKEVAKKLLAISPDLAQFPLIKAKMRELEQNIHFE